ncbi:nitrogen regulation protein NR(II), partial [Verrucomicrobiota bacterium]
PEHRILGFYAVPLSPDAGKENGAVVILRDITRSREEEASLVESERLNAVKLLAAGVAHEIGNPLNALNIHLQLIDREIRDLPEGAAAGLGELVDVARKEVTRLDLIITQFLRALRPTRPKLTSVEIERVIEDALVLLRQEIEDRSIDVSIEKPESLPKVRVDRNQMQQAFFNIIKNAFQSMSDGGTLRISLGVTDRLLAVSFRDTGQGISAEDMGRIFEPYHTTKAQGSGLGLMIVQRIVQDHGGQIEVASKPGQGTAFTVLLPLWERRVRLLRAPTGEGRKGASPAGAGSPVADDQDPAPDDRGVRQVRHEQ